MNRRIKILEFTKALQPFLQGGVITPNEAKEIANEFLEGGSEKIRALIYSPTIPMAYSRCIENIKTFIQ